jgi:hypothetical protein
MNQILMLTIGLSCRQPRRISAFTPGSFLVVPLGVLSDGYAP